MAVSLRARDAIRKACRLGEPETDAFLDDLIDASEKIELAAGQTVFEQGRPIDALWVVESGSVVIHGGTKEQQLEIHTARADDLIAPTIEPVAGRTAFVATTLEPSVLWRIPKAALDNAQGPWPRQTGCVLEAAAAQGQFLTLCTAIRQSIAFANVNLTISTALAHRAHYMVLSHGDTLIRPGDAADAIYIVIVGRLNVMRSQHDGSMKTANEIGPGESVGEVKLVTGQRHTDLIVARRDTSLLRLDRMDYLHILRQEPDDIIRNLVQTVQGYTVGVSRMRSRRGGSLPSYVLLPSRPGLPMRECGEALRDVLSRRGSVALITAQTCLAAGFGSYKGEIEDDGHGNFDLLDWLGNQESDNFCVIYVADDENSIWTQICLGHADQLFIVINGGDEPMLGTLEQQIHQDPRLADLPSTALFLQPQDIKIPSNTARHLALRQCKDHFHLRRSQRDWERIGRFLTGHAVGLVLGGGGARGFSHLGVIRALEEIGVPIDMVGGTSVGALISSLYAFGMSHQEILQHMMDMVHRSEQITLPLVSLMSGKRFSRGIKDLLGTSMIEDMWRTFFCISCNLSRAATVVHSKGSARQAVLASNSPPGLLPPVVVNRELHVDGALLNGLPLDVMGNLNKGGLLIVVDVQPREELFSDASTEDGLSGWRVLRERLFPKKNQARDPGIVEILSRSMAIGGLANRERLLKRATDLLLTPPTAQYAITDHKLGFEIADVGYQDTHKRVLSWWENQPKL